MYFYPSSFILQPSYFKRGFQLTRPAKFAAESWKIVMVWKGDKGEEAVGACDPEDLAAGHMEFWEAIVRDFNGIMGADVLNL